MPQNPPKPNTISVSNLKLCQRKFSTCVYLRGFEVTCIDFCRAQIHMQVEAGFSPFGHPSQVRTQALVFANFRRLARTCINLRVCFARALYIPWISSKALWRPYEMWETEARTSLRRGRKRDLRNCSFSATESSQCKLHFLLPSH